MSWAWSFYLREWSLLYKHKRIMSSCLCSEWSLWLFLSKMSKMSNMLVMLTVITSDSSDQSNHFKTLITQWLFNHCYYIISCERVLTLDFLLRFSFQKSLFSSCLLIAQSKILSHVTEIFLNVRVLSVLSCVLMNIAVACKRNVVLTMKSIAALSVCISIASAILLSQWWSEKE